MSECMSMWLKSPLLTHQMACRQLWRPKQSQQVLDTLAFIFRSCELLSRVLYTRLLSPTATLLQVVTYSTCTWELFTSPVIHQNHWWFISSAVLTTDASILCAWQMQSVPVTVHWLIPTGFLALQAKMATANGHSCKINIRFCEFLINYTINFRLFTIKLAVEVNSMTHPCFPLPCLINHPFQLK